MKTRDLEMAERLACVLADDMMSRLPAAFEVPGEQILAVTWPLAVTLVRLQRKAKKNRRDAKAYRRVCREVRAALASPVVAVLPQPEASRRLVPFDPAEWQFQRVAGSAAREPARQEAA